MELKDTELNNRANIAAMEENMVDYLRLMYRWQGITNYISDSYLQGVSNEQNAFFNGVIRTRMNEANVDEGIATAIGRCRERGVSMMWVRLPSDEPEDLGEALKRHDVTLGFSDPAMVVDPKRYRAAAGRPATLVMQPMTDDSLWPQWVQVLAKGFEFPADTHQPLLQMNRRVSKEAGKPMESILGWWQGKPAATGTLLFGGRAAGIYNVTTLPQAQRQGIGLAMCDFLLQRAWQRGCELVCLQASQAGYNLYRRLGFQTISEVHFHFWNHDSSGG